MIRKRQPQKTEAEKPVVVNKPTQQKQTQQKSKYKEFKTYREEAIYVLNLLESQGIDIYDESRYGGMYLNQHSSSAKAKHIFTNNKNNKNNKPEQDINNTESDIDFSKLFGSKK